MRSIIKVLALVMAVLMLVGVASICTFAADEEVDYTDAAKKLASINIMKGDTNGDLMLENGVTRYQAALFFVQALTGETAVEKWNADKQSDVFGDVPEYGTAIDYAYGIKLILGRGNGVYGYNDPITYQDMLVMGVRALGYETEDMKYPIGYLVAADDLKLNEDLAKGISNTKALTRGETAQIIWNMLNIEIAAVDPVTDKILYPGQYSVSDSILGAPVERTTLLEEAGFSQTVIKSEIAEYNPAETSNDIATVVLENGMEIAAAELGITSRTNKSDFLGLPITLYVDSKTEADFERDYDIVAEDSDATIIFADTLSFTTVKNVGAEENIKATVNSRDVVRLTLGDNTFGDDKYNFDVRVLTEDGWVSEDASVLENNFLYDSGEKEFSGSNSYGEISYAVDTEEVGDELVYNLIVLYKPYSFGRYFTRNIRYQPTVTDESFITIGNYSMNTFKNIDDDTSHFIETFLGTDKVCDNSVTSVSKTYGEAARDAKISGGSVRSGDFIFYYYNELDNVLSIGLNCGTFKEGVLTSHNSAKETVKIGGTTYEYGFAGAYESNLPEFGDYDIANDYLNAIESGKKNAKYVEVNGNVIYMEPVDNSGDKVKHNYVIATVDPEIMSDLLGLTEAKYLNKLTDDGVYVAESGNMNIAVLNTSTGDWTLAEVAQYEYGRNGLSTSGYDYDENEFPNVVDMASSIANYDAYGESFKNYAKYEEARDALLRGGMFAVRENQSGVYKLSALFGVNDTEMIDNGINKKGLFFSESTAKSNLIKATRNSDVDEARVTLTANTVIVVVAPDGTVGVRKGIQGEENSIEFAAGDTETGWFYTATARLIVLRLPESEVENTNNYVYDKDFVEQWQGQSAAGADETYYVGLSSAEVGYERLDDGTYEFTVAGIYNLKTMRTVSAIKFVVEDLDDTTVEDVDISGLVLHMNKRGVLVVSDLTPSAALANSVNMRYDVDDFVAVDMSNVEFDDESSITVDEFGLDKKNAVAKINMTVATLDITDIDMEDYDISNIAYAEIFDEDNAWEAGSVEFERGTKYYEYVIDSLGNTQSINEPVAGVLDQYIIDTMNEQLYIAGVDDDYFETAASVAVDLVACGTFDEDTGIVDIYVVKLLYSVPVID